jgi:outer membrane protein TolC
VKQIEARIRVARAKAGQVTAFPDPRLSVGLQNMPIWPARFDETPMTGLQITLTQVIPWPTRLTLAGQVARKRAEVAAAALAEARLRLAAAIRIQVLELALRDAERRIEKERDDLLERLLKVVRARYRVQKAQLQDLLKARLSRSRVADRLLRIARARDLAEARLNALLGRPAHARLPPHVKAPQPPRLKATLPRLLQRAQKSRPALARWKRRMTVQSLRRKQAYTGYFPDFGVSLGYRYRQDSGMDPVEGMDFWSVGVSVRIPLWSLGKTRAAVREAEAALSRERSGYENERLQVARQVRAARDAIMRLQGRLRLYRQRIVPQARQTLEAAIASYTTGKLDFLSVLEHEQALYRHRLDLLRVRVRLAQQWAVLRAAVGEKPDQTPAQTKGKGS